MSIYWAAEIWERRSLTESERSESEHRLTKLTEHIKRYVLGPKFVTQSDCAITLVLLDKFGKEVPYGS